MSNIKQNNIMKKEYIKPFAKVKVVEMVVMQEASLLINSSGSGTYENAGAKEFNDFFE